MSDQTLDVEALVFRHVAERHALADRYHHDLQTHIAVDLLVRTLEAADRVMAGYGVDAQTRGRIVSATAVQVLPDPQREVALERLAATITPAQVLREFGR